jgi:hypothetical protein
MKYIKTFESLKSASNLYTYDSILNNVKNFTNKYFYADVKYSDLLYSCELSKGNCMDVSTELFTYLKELGYTDISLVNLYKPKFDISNAHYEYKFDKNIVHQVVKIKDYYIDLTGSQFSAEQSGIKIYNKNDISKNWGKLVLNENNQDFEIVYRGQEIESDKLSYIWVSRDIEHAKLYGNITEYKMPKKLNILDTEYYAEWEKLIDEFEFSEGGDYDDYKYEPSIEFMNFLQEKGYDGFENGDNILIFNSSNIFI